MSVPSEITISQAVELSKSKLSEFYKDATSVRLEEVLRTEGDQNWLITLSFLTPYLPDSEGVHDLWPDPTTSRPLRHRDYKSFEVDRHTGHFIAMKIREAPSV